MTKYEKFKIIRWIIRNELASIEKPTGQIWCGTLDLVSIGNDGKWKSVQNDEFSKWMHSNERFAYSISNVLQMHERRSIITQTSEINIVTMHIYSYLAIGSFHFVMYFWFPTSINIEQISITNYYTWMIVSQPVPFSASNAFDKLSTKYLS